jgi:hypothetical protein
VSVYVDDYKIRADVPNGPRVVRGVWCHMTADTTDELLAMAKTIGMKPSWIQKPGTWQEHFDVTLSKRKLAIAAGAIEVGMLDSVRAMRARWEARTGASMPPTSMLASALQVRLGDLDLTPEPLFTVDPAGVDGWSDTAQEPTS